MNKFLLRLRIFSELAIAGSLGYIISAIPSLTTFLSVLIITGAIYFFFDALDAVDKLNGYGKYHKKDS